MRSYEEAMELPIEIGDATDDGGEMQLGASEVARFMDAHLDEMYDEWEELGATLFDAEKIIDRDRRYSDMEVALGRLAKLNEDYLRMATKLFSEKSS